MVKRLRLRKNEDYKRRKIILKYLIFGLVSKNIVKCIKSYSCKGFVYKWRKRKGVFGRSDLNFEEYQKMFKNIHIQDNTRKRW